MANTPANFDRGADADDELPRVASPTDAEQVIIDAEQKKMATVFAGRFDMSPTNRELHRAVATVKEMAAIPVTDLSPKQKTRYAEALGKTGDYEAAFELSGDERYAMIAEAMKNSVPCECPDVKTFEIVNNAPTEVTYSRMFKKMTIYNAKLRRPIALMCCNKCGNLICQDDNR